ncbi:MAG: 7-cyano-7-deazaguanine synthase [Candidatus Geothermincolia bacterium]
MIKTTCTPEAARLRSYDVLMAFSGGKDSTYTLLLLRRKYGLRVLAMSFDNGFISPRALENIKAVTEAVGIDHVLFRPRWDLLRKIFATAAEKELYSKKTLERASTICTSCIGLVKATCLKMAIEQGIPMIGFGWSPGQAPVQSSIMRNNPALLKMTQRAILGPLEQVAGADVAAYFLGDRHFAEPEKFPWNVHPLAWEDYDEGDILKEIAKLGWRMPEDTDSNSTNCLLNAYANQIHVQRYGFHPYIWEIANMVREGIIPRAEGLHKFEKVVPPEWIRMAQKKLGSLDGELEENESSRRTAFSEGSPD